MAKKSAVYWDANAFLALINNDKTPAEMDGCNAVWEGAVRGKILIMTSTFTNAEVIYMKGTPKLDPSKRQRVANFFRQPFIIQRPVTRRISELARDVVWDSNVKPKDAVHISTAGFYRIPEFHTFDGPLLTHANILVDGFSIQCKKPWWRSQIEMNL